MLQAIWTILLELAPWLLLGAAIAVANVTGAIAERVHGLDVFDQAAELGFDLVGRDAVLLRFSHRHCPSRCVTRTARR